MIQSQMNLLRLVYPPMSNQEAEWLKTDDEVLERLRRSNLYMIVRRPEAFLRNLRQIEELSAIAFDFEVEGIGADGVELHFVDAPARGYVVPEKMELEAGSKFVRVWRLGDDGTTRVDVFDWFSTEALLYMRSRSHPAMRGLDRYREFARYELLYTGISKDEDAFTRLVLRPHEKRVRILSNEHPLGAGSRVTDEMFLLFFQVKPILVQTFVNDDDVEQVFGDKPTMQTARVVADAEKAFTSIMQCQYNTIRFKNYPAGRDGLHGSGLWRYGYAIDEDITLVTKDATIRGARAEGVPVSNEADGIFIEGDAVELLTPDDLRKRQE